MRGEVLPQPHAQRTERTSLRSRWRRCTEERTASTLLEESKPEFVATRQRPLVERKRREENGKAVSTWTHILRAQHPSHPTLRWVWRRCRVAAHAESAQRWKSRWWKTRSRPASTRHAEADRHFRDAKGSYLATADGLRCARSASGQTLRAVKLPGKNNSETNWTFLQTDGAAWDEFSIEGREGNRRLRRWASSRSTHRREKPIVEKPVEPGPVTMWNRVHKLPDSSDWKRVGREFFAFSPAEIASIVA